MSGPTGWPGERVLGIPVLEPGCRVLRMVPHLGDLEWAEVTYATPKGVVRVRHEKCPDGSIRAQIQAPRGVQVVRK